MHNSPFALAAVLGLGLATTAPAAIAQTPPIVELSDAPVRHQAITAGTVRVVVNYEPKGDTNREQPNLRYDIYINDELKAQVQDEVWLFGQVAIQALDPDDTPEVVVNTYTGGAHCCTIWNLYSWQGDRLHHTQTYPLDGGGGSLADLDGDGYVEFMTGDNRFLYTFSSYAGSYPPLIILSFRGGQLIDVTRQFRDRQRSIAYGMYQAISEGEPYQVNGILAGYVAQKILLGEYEQGWDYMLAHYDREDSWGLDIVDNRGDTVGSYSDFPEALNAFLIDTGYLTYEGYPNPRQDLAKTVVERVSLVD